MSADFKSIKWQDTWELTELPEGKKANRNRWTFKLRKVSKRRIERCKARFCAKGFTQIEGVVFTETFAPVAKVNSIHVVLSIATTHDLELHQADVDTAFLNDDVDSEIYMKQPVGFVEPGKGHLMYKLKKCLKCLYGTEEAARQWYLNITKSSMKKNGYTRCEADKCVFIKEDRGNISVIAIYVDDLIITRDPLVEMTSIIAFLKRSFSIKDLGNV
jgi:hypothetical protein